MDWYQHGLIVSVRKMDERSMKKFIYQVGHEYFTIEAESMQDAMVLVACEGGVVIGDYTMYAHMFGE